MKYDEVYDNIGHIGRYQIWALIGSCLLSLYDSEPTTIVFVAGDMSHFCKIDRLANFSHEQQKNIAIPWKNDRSKQFDQCTKFDIDYELYSDDQLREWNRTVFMDSTGGNISLKRCSQWVYEQDVYTSNIISQYDLVCDTRRHLPAFSSTLYMMGGLVGAILAGIISDRYGRRIAILAFMLPRLVGGAISTFAPLYEVFAVGNFILGAGGCASRIVSYALVAELLGPRYRMVGMGAKEISLTLGVIGCAILAYFVRDMFQYRLVYFTPLLLLFIILVVTTPESPRWLFAKGRYDQLNDLFQHIAKVNRRKLPDDFDTRKIEKNDSSQRSSRSNASVLSFVSNPALRTRLLVVMLGWFTNSLTYYYIILNAGSLFGSVFLNTCIIGILGIPSLTTGMILCNTKLFGRRRTSIYGLPVLALLKFITIPLIIYGFDLIVTILSFVSVSILTVFHVSLVVHSSELFPTEVRNIALGCSLMSARFASMIAPYMGSALADIWSPLPAAIIGCFATITAISYRLLPETFGKPICESLQDIQHRSKSKPSEIADGRCPTIITITTLVDSNSEENDHHFNSASTNGSTTPTDHCNGSSLKINGSFNNLTTQIDHCNGSNLKMNGSSNNLAVMDLNNSIRSKGSFRSLNGSFRSLKGSFRSFKSFKSAQYEVNPDADRLENGDCGDGENSKTGFINIGFVLDDNTYVTYI